MRYGTAAAVRVEETTEGLVLRSRTTDPASPSRAGTRLRALLPLEESRNRATGGTGLGLGIARNIARTHGGDVVLRNRPEGGFEALLSLPWQSALIVPACWQ